MSSCNWWISRSNEIKVTHTHMKYDGRVHILNLKKITTKNLFMRMTCRRKIKNNFVRWLNIAFVIWSECVIRHSRALCMRVINYEFQIITNQKRRKKNEMFEHNNEKQTHKNPKTNRFSTLHSLFCSISNY